MTRAEIVEQSNAWLQALPGNVWEHASPVCRMAATRLDLERISRVRFQKKDAIATFYGVSGLRLVLKCDGRYIQVHLDGSIYVATWRGCDRIMKYFNRQNGSSPRWWDDAPIEPKEADENDADNIATLPIQTIDPTEEKRR